MMRSSPGALRRLALAVLALVAVHAPLPATASSKEGGSFDANTGVQVMPFLNVSVIRNGVPKAVLAIGLGLELSKPEMAAEVQHMTPKLQDAYMLAATRFAQDMANLRAPVDVAALTAALQTATDKQLGTGKAKVLISYAQVMRR